MINLNVRAVCFLMDNFEVKLRLILLLLTISNLVFSNHRPPKEKTSSNKTASADCNARDNLDWAQVSEGAKPSKQTYKKQGLRTTVASKNAAGVSSSLKVGKKFKNTTSLEWSASGVTRTQSSQMSLTFNLPPDQFELNLFDIDKENDDLIDSLVVNAYVNGSVVNLSVANIASIGPAVVFLGNNSFRGIQNANDVVSSDGNITITFSVAVDSVVLHVNNASVTAKMNSAVEVGLGNLSWCATVNHAPIILDEDGNPTTIINAITPYDEALRLCVSTIDVDSVFVKEIVPDSDGGILAASAPDTCLQYTPTTGFNGEQSFMVTWCDDRTPSMCTQARVVITVLPLDQDHMASEALSPNGDGVLDSWIIQGIEQYPNNEVHVFNIWGDVVFEQKHYDNEENAWHGDANRGMVMGNKKLPDGTYYYIINLGNGSAVRKGFIVVKR